MEVLSSTSEPEEPAVEDAEFQAATQHLTQDFLCQMIREEEGWNKMTPDSEQELGSEGRGAGLQRQVAPLAAILGKLPGSTSLDFQRPFQTFNKSETCGKSDGKRLYYVIITSSAWETGVYPDIWCCSWCFVGEESDGGELDLDGIDDQEIEKVSSLCDHRTNAQITIFKELMCLFICYYSQTRQQTVAMENKQLKSLSAFLTLQNIHYYIIYNFRFKTTTKKTLEPVSIYFICECIIPNWHILKHFLNTFVGQMSRSILCMNSG